MSWEEEDTCMSWGGGYIHVRWGGEYMSYEEEDTYMSYEEEDRCQYLALWRKGIIRILYVCIRSIYVYIGIWRGGCCMPKYALYMYILLVSKVAPPTWCDVIWGGGYMHVIWGGGYMSKVARPLREGITHACHIRRRIHAWQIRRRMHTNRSPSGARASYTISGWYMVASPSFPKFWKVSALNCLLYK